MSGDVHCSSACRARTSFGSLRHKAVFTNSSWLNFAVQKQLTKQTLATGFSTATAPETLQLLSKCFHRMKRGRRLDLPNTVCKLGSQIQSFENQKKMQFNWEKTFCRKTLSKGNISAWETCKTLVLQKVDN